MFTGIIEEIGEIQYIRKSVKSAEMKIKAGRVLQDVKPGDSISTNGVCLTVKEHTSGSFKADVMAETMRRSNLSLLSPGDEVNLERALPVGGRLGGHIVSGHIDGMGNVSKYEKEDNAVWITVSASPEVIKYVVLKGSVTVDGVSLTVTYVDEKVFQVSVIPHTVNLTTLVRKNTGSAVNLECDIIGKYVEKLIFSKEQEQKPKPEKMDMEFLSRNGFI